MVKSAKWAKESDVGTIKTCHSLQVTGKASMCSKKHKSKGMVVTMELCTASASTTEEPDAGKPHVRICMGGVE